MDVVDRDGFERQLRLGRGSGTDGYLASSRSSLVAPLGDSDKVVGISYTLASGSGGAMRSSGHLGDRFELTPDRGFLSERAESPRERSISAAGSWSARRCRIAWSCVRPTRCP